MIVAQQRESIRRSLVGATFGVLLAIALIAANTPVPLPPSAALTCLLAAAIGALAAFLVPRASALFLVVIAIATLVLSLTPLTAKPVHAWIRRDTMPQVPADAVVVLAAGVNADGLVDAIGTERLLSALDVARRNDARLLVTTRVYSPPGDSRLAPLDDYRRLISLAGDTTRWRVVGPVRTTHDEAVATSQLLAPASRYSIIVVTSPLHARRACATFEGVGFRVTCVPAESRNYPVHAFRGARTRLAATADWLYERAAMIEYRWRGWVR